MEDSGESDVFSERDERSVASDSYDEIEFEDLDSFALDKNANKSDDEEGPYSQEPLTNDQLSDKSRRRTKQSDSTLHVSAVQTLSTFSFELLPDFDHHQNMESCARQSSSLNSEH